MTRTPINGDSCRPTGAWPSLRARTVMPTVHHQRRMFSSSPRRALDGSQIKQPDVYDLSPQVPQYQDVRQRCPFAVQALIAVQSINKTNEVSTRAVTYLVVGATGLITFAGIRGAVRMAIGSMSPAMDVLAMSKIEVDISKARLASSNCRWLRMLTTRRSRRARMSS